MADLNRTPDEEQTAKRVCDAFHRAEKYHAVHRKQWERRYSLYRSYKDWNSTARTANSPRDRDGVIGDGRSMFGFELFIPYTFAAVEQLVPRQLANRPRMLIVPDDNAVTSWPGVDAETLLQNAENMRWLIDQQQSRIDYELILQDPCKDGQIYGIGIQKTYWQTRKRQMVVQRQSILDSSRYVQATQDRVLYDGPMAERVDPFDFLWDPRASELDQCEYVIHRTWRSTQYVLGKLASGEWAREPNAPPLTAQDVERMGPSSTRYAELWNVRDRASGMNQGRDTAGLHEVWEFHTGAEVITILDGQIPVVQGPNPLGHGEMPFQIYRPTKVGGQFVGIGIVEPVEDLQEEMNILRNQRRWNAALKLMQVFAYQEGAIDPDELEYAPGQAWPVRAGVNPSEAIFPFNQGDIPFSSYREAQEMQSDFDRVTGLLEPDSQGVAATATGAQLVDSAINRRIGAMTRRLEVELIKRACCQWIALNQQHVTGQVRVTMPQAPQPGQDLPTTDTRVLGPGDLMGPMQPLPEGGATVDNAPQKLQQAQAMMLLLGQRPEVDQRRLVQRILRLLDLGDPQQFMAPDEPHIPLTALHALMGTLQQGGVPPRCCSRRCRPRRSRWVSPPARPARNRPRPSPQASDRLPALPARRADPEARADARRDASRRPDDRRAPPDVDAGVAASAAPQAANVGCVIRRVT